MKYHSFPGTDLSVSQLCFGCWGIISDAHWGERAEEDSHAAMTAALDSGVNFFDTAPIYGDGASEELLGRFLAQRGVREQTIVASKIRPDKMRAADVMVECDESLRRLRTDYIDLYQTHWTSREVPITETWDAMERLQQQGKVRHLGVCNMGTGDLEELPKRPLSNQLPFNLLWRAIESTILPRCVEDGVGVLAYSPLMHGMLAGNYHSPDQVPDSRARTRHFSHTRPQTRHDESGCEARTFAAIHRIREIATHENRSMSDVALAWTIQQAGLVSVIAGARTAQQMQDNLRFLEPLTPTTLSALNEATDELKQILGPNPDMWDSGTQSRYR